jgi:hypothetical protein
MKLPRFTLRDLFWLVLVVAMPIGLWVEHNRQLRIVQRAQRREREQLIAEVTLHDGRRAEAIKWARLLYKAHSEKAWGDAFADDDEVLRFAQKYIERRYWLDEKGEEVPAPDLTAPTD